MDNVIDFPAAARRLASKRVERIKRELIEEAAHRTYEKLSRRPRADKPQHWVPCACGKRFCICRGDDGPEAA